MVFVGVIGLFNAVMQIIDGRDFQDKCSLGEVNFF